MATKHLIHDLNPDKISRREIINTCFLGCIFSTRLLGLFMILPIFSLYAEKLSGATPLLIGIALGVYGLTQACLQIPFGMASDHFGRKKIIALGLIIFAIGSMVAASSSHISGIIIGRALQGAGAIGSSIMALAADLTPANHRSKTMAILGAMIGVSFMLALSLGPLLDTWIGIHGIFYITALLAISGIFILYRFVDTPYQEEFHQDTEIETSRFKRIMLNPQLAQLNIGIFILHAILTASFIAIPLVLKNKFLFNPDKYGLFYIAILTASFLAMFPWLRIAERKHWLKAIFSIAILILLLAELLLLTNSFLYFTLGLFLFFTAFSYLEASLPALVSRIAPSSSKGTAMGIYSTAQFMGIFLGGIIGGWLYEYGGAAGIFIVSSLALLLWLLISLAMKVPGYLTSLKLEIGPLSKKQAQILQSQLLSTAGVLDARIAVHEGIAYLKIDEARINKKTLHKNFIHKR